MKRVCVIGAGLGGLALAIRLQSSGIATTLVEARDKPGGCAYFREEQGFVFDFGPTIITEPASLRELWELSGHDMAADLELMEVRPFFRLNWTDGTTFDLSNDAAALSREIARISVEDIHGYDEFMRFSENAWREAYPRLTQAPFLDLASMARAMPTLLRHQAWRSLYATVSSFIKSEKLRQALCFQTLFFGGNPMSISGVYAGSHKHQVESGVWWARGGTNRLVAGLVRHFERLGGVLRLHDPVLHVHTLGDRVTEVETVSGWRERFDAIASNADVVHSYRDLLSGTTRGGEMARRLTRKSFSPGLFIVHFGLEGTWPGIPHHTMLFGPRFEGLLDDLYKHGVLPQDFAIYLHHPSVTDPSVAPPGKSTFYAMIPVANMGKLPIDWEQIGPMMERRILDEVGRRLIPDIHDRVITSLHYAPRDFALDLNAWIGGAFSLEPVPLQSAWLRPHNRDDKLQNFYLVGAGTHPGAGIVGVVAGAKITAKLMLEDLRS